VAVSVNFLGELVVIDENAVRGCGTSCYTTNISGSSQASAFISGVAALMVAAAVPVAEDAARKQTALPVATRWLSAQVGITGSCPN
jgi:hypothetical protein